MNSIIIDKQNVHLLSPIKSELIEDFFKAFMNVSSDVQGLTTNSEEDDLTSIYNNLCVTEGEDVYLSDGLWLTESGNLIEK